MKKPIGILVDWKIVEVNPFEEGEEKFTVLIGKLTMTQPNENYKYGEELHLKNPTPTEIKKGRITDAKNNLFELGWPNRFFLEFKLSKIGTEEAKKQGYLK